MTTALSPRWISSGANTIFVDAINNRGEAAGGYIENGEDYGFVYDNGTYTTLSVAGASNIFVEAINDRSESFRPSRLQQVLRGMGIFRPHAES